MLKPLGNLGIPPILNRELHSSLLCSITCIFSQSLNTFTVCQLWRLEGLYTTSQSLGRGRKQQVSITQTSLCIPIYSCNCLFLSADFFTNGLGFVFQLILVYQPGVGHHRAKVFQSFVPLESEKLTRRRAREETAHLTHPLR